MGNQKEISSRKLERIRWRQKDGLFYGEMEISRKPFGTFNVNMTVSVNSGNTLVEIKNLAFSLLSWTNTYPNYPQAVLGIKKRFEWIDSAMAELPKETKDGAKEVAKERYVQALSYAVGLAVLGKEQMEEQQE